MVDYSLVERWLVENMENISSPMEIELALYIFRSLAKIRDMNERTSNYIAAASITLVSKFLDDDHLTVDTVSFFKPISFPFLSPGSIIEGELIILEHINYNMYEVFRKCFGDTRELREKNKYHSACE